MIIAGKNRILMKLLLFALVIIFSCTGMAYARWTDGLQLTGKVEMGSIDPRLVSVQVVPVSNYFYDDSFLLMEPMVNITTDLANNSARLDINGARPGFEYKVYYQVRNEGTIPIMLKIPKHFSNPGLSVDFEPIRIEGKSSGTAEITITVGDEEDINYIDIPLTFIQAVGIKGVDL